MPNAEETKWIVRKLVEVGVEVEQLKKQLGHQGTNPVAGSLAATWRQRDAHTPGGIPATIDAILSSIT
jgi:hypothetical protein